MIAPEDEGSVAVILLMFRFLLIDGRETDSLGSIGGGWLDRAAVERLRCLVLPRGTSISIGSPTPSFRFHWDSECISPSLSLPRRGVVGRSAGRVLVYRTVRTPVVGSTAQASDTRRFNRRA